MTELEAALHSDYHEQQNAGNAVGNWRTHRLVKCANCKGLMGHYKETVEAVCVDCELEQKNNT